LNGLRHRNGKQGHDNPAFIDDTNLDLPKGKKSKTHTKEQIV